MSINKLIVIIIKMIMTMMFINNDHDYVKERNTMTMTMTMTKIKSMTTTTKYSLPNGGSRGEQPLLIFFQSGPPYLRVCMTPPPPPHQGLDSPLQLSLP